MLKDIRDGILRAIELNARVTAVAEGVKELASEVREIDRRLVRVETIIEVARPADGATLRIAAKPTDRD